jgi:hypothetical protein
MGLPVWKCHKEVRAAKIIDIKKSEGYITLSFESGDSTNIPHQDLLHKPVPSIGMYYVKYRDNYFSFSPAIEFEDGYSLKD